MSHCKTLELRACGAVICRFGEDYPAMALSKHLRCNNCRGRMANLHEVSR
jgi:hypothetical protein